MTKFFIDAHAGAPQGIWLRFDPRVDGGASSMLANPELKPRRGYCVRVGEKFCHFKLQINISKLNKCMLSCTVEVHGAH